MAVKRIHRTTLSLPFELGDNPQALDHYNEWLERTVLDSMRKTEPESYQAIVENLKDFVLNSRDDDVVEPEPDLARLRPLFVLGKLSRRLRSDVLADGSIISACGFTAKRQVQAIDEIVVIRDELFAAFRNASKVPLVCRLHDPNNALFDATISINEDGSATVEIAGKKIRFPWITLLSSDADAHLARLDEFLPRYPLHHGDAAFLRALVARADFSGDDFLATAGLLESSPENFIERLVDKVRHRGEPHRAGRPSSQR